MGETTIAAKAQSKYMSLRTTIPVAVVRQLNIKEGDKLHWEFAADSGEIIVKFGKIKGS
jgi:bifunctional DNA-binding transcriptional regulator/antitoxin component of YhaV-PrlF toxin-antitoxin module